MYCTVVEVISVSSISKWGHTHTQIQLQLEIHMCVFTYFLGFLRALLTWIMAVLVLFVLLRVSHVAVAIRILSQWRRTGRGGEGLAV